MFGNKLRSWMEAVRPRKKQHRKEKQNKTSNNQADTKPASNWQNNTTNYGSQNDLTKCKAPGNENTKTNRRNQTNTLAQNPAAVTTASCSRYSANNLSSPESAYSTGYSTDGTSPGAPPEYYINIRTGVKYFPTNSVPAEAIQRSDEIVPDASHRPKPTICASSYIPIVTVHQNSCPEPAPPRAPHPPPAAPDVRLTEVLASPVLTSPRQRNRIRTNPWLPGSSLSPNPARQSQPVTPIVRVSAAGSPRFQSPASTKRVNLVKQSLSSSSCSSLSAASVHYEPKRTSASDEDDCTLNEMMGKYDESYIYEKETDILSDSDPTDCDTDIDTGQDGGDEDDPLEFDFIDNDSYLELDLRHERNTGHCTYFNFDAQRKNSRRRTTRRSKHQRRSSSNRKRHKAANEPSVGSRSAGATPLSVRRSKHHGGSKLALADCLKKRANSISWDPICSIDKRDKEADRKYKELIGEAEQILRNMKSSCLSPRRVPGPANKRVEILRSAECKQELFLKNRLIEETGQLAKPMPSTNFSCPRFSPKRNHITNFMINNSPVLVRREGELPKSLLVARPAPPKPTRAVGKPRSPKYRKKVSKAKCLSSSSDEEGAKEAGFGCPQSEPVRRKVYFGRGKQVAFNLNSPVSHSPKRFEEEKYKMSAENLRQQVLVTTITNLKRNLEYQSASLKQVYRSSQNIHL